MAVRLRQHEGSALKIAHWLRRSRRSGECSIPRCPIVPATTVAARLQGSSGLFSFELKLADAACAAFVDALEMFGIGYSWGGFESLVPVDPERSVSVAPRPTWSASISASRIADDLIDDLDQLSLRVRR